MKPLKSIPKMRHKMVVETAKKMTEVLYEELLLDNEFHRNPTISRARFIEKNYHLLLADSRHTLALMLSTASSEELKHSIADALIKDDGLMRGRITPTF